MGFTIFAMFREDEKMCSTLKGKIILSTTIYSFISLGGEEIVTL